MHRFLLLVPLFLLSECADHHKPAEKAPRVQNQGPFGPFCGPNARAVRCPPCEGTCTDPNPSCSRPFCPPWGRPRCECRAGFVRFQGRCIRPTNCPRPNCPPNQVWTQCSTVCEPSCRDMNPTCQSFACGPPKCQCRPGFYRQFGPTSACVPWWQCRRPWWGPRPRPPRPGGPGGRPWNWWD